jgi:hypothetical protein
MPCAGLCSGATSHSLCELVLETPNWDWREIKIGQKTEDKHAESWSQVGWVLGWRHTTALSTSSEFIIYGGKKGGRAAFLGGGL